MNTLKKTLAVLAAITMLLPASVGAGSVCYAADKESSFQIVTERPEEGTYTGVFKIVDGETGEPIEGAECSIEKNANGTSLCLAEWQWNTTDEPVKTIEDLPRLIYGFFYAVNVKLPVKDYGGGTYSYFFNMQRNDEPQEIVVKCYKSGKDPKLSIEGNIAEVRFYDELSHMPVSGVKAKVICGTKDDDGQFIEDGPTWDVDEWTSTNESLHTVVTTGSTASKQGYYLSVEVPEGYEPVKTQEIIINDHEDAKINIPLKHTDGCDVSISVIDSETKESLKNANVSLYYDDEYELASWSLDEDPVKKIDDLMPVLGDGWYSLVIDYTNEYRSLRYWFKVDENSKEQEITLETPENINEVTVQLVDRFSDSGDADFQVSLFLIDGDKETLIDKWTQNIGESKTVTVGKVNKDSKYKLTAVSSDGYKAVDDYVLFDFKDGSIYVFPPVQKNENRTAKVKFVDGDTGEAIQDVKTRLVTNPTGQAVFIDEASVSDKGETEFKELIRLNTTEYGIVADLPDGYDDQVYTFNFDKDENEKEIVCKAYKKDSTKRFKGCAAKFSILDKFDNLALVGAKAILFEHSGSDMPAQVAGWTVDNVYDIQYIDGLKPDTTYSLYIDEATFSKLSDEDKNEIVFSFDKDGEFKEITTELRSKNLDLSGFAVYDFDTKETIDFISADLYEKTAFGKFLVKHFDEYSELSTFNVINKLSGADYYEMEVVVSDKYRDSTIVCSYPNASTVTMFEGTGDVVMLDGDANCDEKVNMGDVVLIMQSIANPDKYGLNGTDKSHITAQGQKNGDIYEKGTGITNSDALQIQKILLGIKD